MPKDYRFLPQGLKSNLGWYDRGYLPHFDGAEIPQFLTFRLADSIPQSVLDKWRKETELLGDEGKVIFRKNIEKYLDCGYGSCYLKRPPIAELVSKSLLFHAGEKYKLVSWVIMPNHIHFLAAPLVGVELRSIAHSIKSYTAHQANKILNRSRQFWQHGPFDPYFRNSDHFVNVIRYIENNPVAAGLCAKASDWNYSSAFCKEGEG